MEQSGVYVKVGLFVLVFFLLILGAIVLLGGGLFGKQEVMLETYVSESVQGLNVGAAVKYRGVPVGTVKAIGFVRSAYPVESQAIRIVMALDLEKTDVKDDESLDTRLDGHVAEGMRVRIASGGLTGAMYMEIDYMDEAEQEWPEPFQVTWTPEHYHLPSAPSTMARLQKGIDEILEDFSTMNLTATMEEIRGLVVDLRKGLAHDVGPTVRNLEKLSAGGGGQRREATRRRPQHERQRTVVEHRQARHAPRRQHDPGGRSGAGERREGIGSAARDHGGRPALAPPDRPAHREPGGPDRGRADECPRPLRRHPRTDPTHQAATVRSDLRGPAAARSEGREVMKGTAIALLILALLAPAACQIGPESTYPDEQRRFALSADRPGAAKAGSGDTILKVREFSISRRFEAREFVHRASGDEWVSDFYNVFFMAPSENLTEQAREWIAASGLFGRTVGVGSLIEGTHMLEGNVAALYADYRKPGAFRAVMEIQLLLLDLREAPATVVAQGTYRKTVPLRSDSATEVVAGWNKALGEILGEAERDLGAASSN
jgi:ABC-type uncharacterized transport system auxiliary subunit